MHRTSWRLVAALGLAAAACRPEFQLKKIVGNEALYTASLREFQRRKWDNAVAGFEKLTTDLPARDSLLSRSFWYLASAHEHLSEYLLSAQSFNRLVETFPEDTLADDAALEAARSYRRLWRRPELDPTYGETAFATYNTLLALYPDSPLIPKAKAELDTLNDWFARKNLITGNYYFGRKAYDSGNIYYKAVLEKWPDVPTARNAGIQLVKSYRAIRYTADASELCSQLRAKYPTDGEVAEACRDIPTVVVAPADSAAPKKPPTAAP
jgi:outer membrane protein assembly factor BamD